MEELIAYIEEQGRLLLFIKTENCGVCDVMLEKVNRLLKQYKNVGNIVVSFEDMKEISAKYLVFTAPTVLLFHQGKEILRESRFISLDNIERTLKMFGK
ncbi:thioredoxin family protein [Bacillus pseudomycoides]|uniref:Thiol reductase thioredoxin n=1 Tax=Bacillus pseudomycoides TaxID=64104 RepID=A0A2B6S4P8_9BACI|nr:thioredoxin family protein [Bacillus pseudomycoides]PEA84399.1 thiol reductase thioredoxin [Bacillus pseudomycoides]PED73998.1 thiol reductase thioredoxin [Bacillus pseudomycoides]PEI42890.1 thiol reductase thioredoxin [Bacillus pseudomycoides]PEJ80395.1 thiol reductase thioredoxin [Bacillus pseudomycoides]PEM22630.1 thiol reductase thioredoxin [Bacillus pseudomycoides]